MKILIANRGEIALRIARTAQRLGHEVVGVTTDVDSASQHAISLNAITVPSYLDGAAIISAARESGCGAIHPGYGFLSENASFAKDVVEADLIWIGPNADVINSMGSKINARAIAESAGVPLIPGYSDSQAEDDLRGAADNIGYPVLIKASAGGGGRGAFGPSPPTGTPAINGLANTGGGGGGSGTSIDGSSGGSGIVLIAYPT